MADKKEESPFVTIEGTQFDKRQMKSWDSKRFEKTYAKRFRDPKAVFEQLTGKKAG